MVLSVFPHTALSVEVAVLTDSSEGHLGLPRPPTSSFYLENTVLLYWDDNQAVMFFTTYSWVSDLGSEAPAETGFALQVYVSFFVSVVNGQVYTVYKYINIYLFSLYAYIHYYFCTDLRTDGFIFFHKGCYYIGGLLPHLFAWLAQNSSTCLSSLLLFSYYSLNCCNWSTVIFVIPTCELWIKQGGFKFGLASWWFVFSWFHWNSTSTCFSVFKAAIINALCIDNGLFNCL